MGVNIRDVLTICRKPTAEGIRKPRHCYIPEEDLKNFSALDLNDKYVVVGYLNGFISYVKIPPTGLLGDKGWKVLGNQKDNHNCRHTIK